jgi:adenine-specific DNA-methyltransferase
MNLGYVYKQHKEICSWFYIGVNMEVKQKQYGQYFTPSLIADFMVMLISKNKKCDVLEPCAGRGVFLNALAEHGYNRTKAYEIDNQLHNESNVKIEYQDFLETNADEKFDVIIGNPPYVRWKNIPLEMKERLMSNQNWSKLVKGLDDLLYFFIIHSVNKLKPGGELIFITPSFWTTTMHSKKVRQILANNGSLELMINFHEMKIFNGVNSNILIFKFIKKHSEQPIKIVNMNHKKTVSKQDIERIERIITSSDLIQEISIDSLIAYSHDQFQADETWRPLPPSVRPLIMQIEQNAGNTLGRICDIGNGMVSGLDEAFKADGISELSSIEKKYIINVVKAKDLKRYKNAGVSHYFYLNSITEVKELEKLPNIYRKLLRYKDRLEKRYSYGTNMPWWHWVFLRNKELIENKRKIVVPCKERFDARQYVRFSLVEGDYYVTQDATAIVIHSDVKEDVRYFLALLNSDLIFEWLKHKGLKRGGVLEFSEKPLSEIPIKRINWEDKDEVKIHGEIVEYVRQLLVGDNLNVLRPKIETLIRKLYRIN